MSCPGMSSAVARRILNHRTTGAVFNFLDRYLCTSPWTQRDQLQQLATELRAIHDNDPPAEQVRRILARVPARFDENVQVTHLLAELNQVFYPGGAGDVEFDSDDSDDDDEADDDEADLLSETLLPEAVYDTADGLVAAKRAPVFGAIPPTAHVNNSMQPITVPNTTPWVAPQSVATHVGYLTPVAHPSPHYAGVHTSNQHQAPMIAFTSPLPQPLPPMHTPQQSNKRARVKTEQSLSASPVASPFPPAPVIQSQTIPSHPPADQQQLTPIPQLPQLSSLAANDSPNTGPRTSNPDSIAQAPAVLSETLTPESAVTPVQPALSFLDTLHSIDDEITMLLDSPAADNSQLVSAVRGLLTKSPEMVENVVEALESLNRIAEIAYFTATCDNSSTKTNSSDYHYRGFHARSAATFAALTIVGFDSSRVIYPARAMMRAIQYQYSLHHRFAPRAGPDAVSEDGRFVMGFVQYLRNLLSADPSNVEIVKYLSDIIEKKDVRTGDYLLTLSVFASSSLDVASRLGANPSQFFAHYTTNMRLWSEASTGDKLYVTELNHSKPPQV
ncbi:hypothetical protein GQ42DRAFT_158096 [Ramicandelaber brevisporus]|nr:hypothetical protein GQ42DRAFT_158096 [Ramicandelaber brevisporus]